LSFVKQVRTPRWAIYRLSRRNTTSLTTWRRTVTQETKLPFTDLPNFLRRHLSDSPPYRSPGIGRNGADSVPSDRGGLSAHSNETISGAQSRTPSAQPVRNVVTALRTSANVNSADACWRPRGQNNIWTPNTAEDTRDGGLALPAVPSARPMNILPDSNRGDARWNCRPKTPNCGAVGIPLAFRQKRMSSIDPVSSYRYVASRC